MEIHEKLIIIKSEVTILNRYERGVSQIRMINIRGLIQTPSVAFHKKVTSELHRFRWIEGKGDEDISGGKT